MQNRPQVNPALQFFYDAFFELTFDRQLGMGVGPIPLTAMFAYSEHYDLGNELEDDLIHFVRQMDIEYLKFSERKSKIGKGSTKSRRSNAKT